MHIIGAMTSLLLSILMSSNFKLLFLLLICNLLDVECRGRLQYNVSSPGHQEQDQSAGSIPPDVKCIDHCKVLSMKKLETMVTFHRERAIMRAEGKVQVVGINTATGSSAVGSKPPNCVSKCKSCKPCTPIRVPVQPGTPNTSEYYPEAWRCKCGGKLYLP